MVPSEVQGELKHLYIAAGELLRHFWTCFPVNSPFLEEKVSESWHDHYKQSTDLYVFITTQCSVVFNCSIQILCWRFLANTILS